MSRSISPWRAIWSSMWSRNGTPVLMVCFPVPSRLMATRMRVSLVLRVISAVRMSVRAVRGETVFGAGGVGLQAFAMGQYRGDAAQGLRTLFGHMDDAGAFLKVVDPQRRGKPGG